MSIAEAREKKRLRFSMTKEGAPAEFVRKFVKSGAPQCITCKKPLGKGAVGVYFHSQKCAAAFALMVVEDVVREDERVEAWDAVERLRPR